MSKDINFKSLFIGDKAENSSVYLSEIDRLLRNHMGWRKNYIPSDIPAISDDERNKDDYQDTLKRQHQVLDELDHRLRSGTIP